jgi:hypothetical protein
VTVGATGNAYGLSWQGVPESILLTGNVIAAGQINPPQLVRVWPGYNLDTFFGPPEAPNFPYTPFKVQIESNQGGGNNYQLGSYSAIPFQLMRFMNSIASSPFPVGSRQGQAASDGSARSTFTFNLPPIAGFAALLTVSSKGPFGSTRNVATYVISMTTGYDSGTSAYVSELDYSLVYAPPTLGGTPATVSSIFFGTGLSGATRVPAGSATQFTVIWAATPSSGIYSAISLHPLHTY